MERCIKNYSYFAKAWIRKINCSETLYIVNVLFLVLLIPLFVPFSPKMPASGVDDSWALGLNQAVAQGLSFGKDIIFTLGPYSAIYTKSYHPATDGMMFWGSLYLACSYWGVLLFLNNKISLRWAVLFAVFLLTYVYSKDTLLFSYPLLVGVLIYKYQNISFRVAVTPYLLLIAFFAPLGLLPLVKGSLIILCGSFIVLSAGLFFFKRQYLYMVSALLVPLITLIFFWILGGQNIGDLTSYISSSLILSASFTEAMSSTGNLCEVLSYLVTATVIMLLLVKGAQTDLVRWFLVLLFFLFLFLSFKAGFTRHPGHGLISGTSILLAALVLPYCIRSQYIAPVLLLAFSTSLYIVGQYTPIAPLKNIQSTYTAAWYGLKQRIEDRAWLNSNFNLVMGYLQAKNHFPQLSGSSDIYSYGQTDLIASGNTWSPRPVFQSYSVFNATLALLNQKHLLSARAPDTIFFKIQPIDNRLPTLEDGASWLALLTNYKPKHLVDNFLVLQRKKNTRNPVTNVLMTKRYSLGETVPVPQTGSLIFVRIDLQPTSWGTLLSVLYKPQELRFCITLLDGSSKEFRFIAEMARAGFVLSPFFEHTEELERFYQSGLKDKKIQSFMIQTESEAMINQWNDSYKATFTLIS